MSCCCDLYRFIAWAKICSGKLAYKTMRKHMYGFAQADDMWDQLATLRCLINSLERYKCITDDMYALDGYLYLGDKKIALSQKNSLYLQSQGKKIQLDESDVNCLSLDDLCLMAEKVKIICSIC